MKLSAIVLSKGESTTQKAIESVEFADEVLIILDTDNELKIENSSKVKVIKHELAGDFSQQRNFAATQAKGEWLLYLDSDETISPELQKEIVSVLNGNVDAYSMKRRDYFWGKELKFGETKTARTDGYLRLVKKNSGQWRGAVHEQFVTSHKRGQLKGYIEHKPHQTIAEFLESINSYSTLRAQELKNNNKSFSLFRLLFYPVGKFFYTYFLKLGFLDGPAGFVYSFMMSFHSFLVQAKLLNL